MITSISKSFKSNTVASVLQTSKIFPVIHLYLPYYLIDCNLPVLDDVCGQALGKELEIGAHEMYNHTLYLTEWAA